MEVVHPRCCGIDVHQASLAVCVTIKEEGKSEKYKLRCGTTSPTFANSDVVFSCRRPCAGAWCILIYR